MNSYGQPRKPRTGYLFVFSYLAATGERGRTSIGGEGGIRTHGTREGTTVFETAPFDRSGTSPQ
jgi:hypothetical protein